MKKILFFFLMLCSAQMLYAQNNPGNCITGIQVCQPIYYQSTPHYGNGGIPELVSGGPNTDCLSSQGEDNSVWYIITVTAPGLLMFNIVPNQPNTDYDWAIWDITNGGCREIYNYTTNTPNAYPPVRCNASQSQGGFNPSGITGLSLTACCASEGPGQTAAFSSALPVVAGQVLALCVDGWSSANQGNGAGYTLDFTPSTASIYDTMHPRFDTISTYCGATDSITFTVSDNPKCSSLASNGSDFRITPALAAPVAAYGLTCGGLGVVNTTSVGLKFNTPLPPGNYVLHAQVGTDGNTLVDDCGDTQSVDDAINFTIIAPPIFAPMPVDVICKTDSTQLNVTITNASQAVDYTYQWSPDLYINDTALLNPEVFPPVTTIYVLTVNQNSIIPCASNDTVNVYVTNLQKPEPLDTTICQDVMMPVLHVKADSITWSFASDSTGTPSQPNINTTKAGFDTLYITNRCGTAPVNIQIVTTAEKIALPDTSVCQGTPVRLDAPNAGDLIYKWNTGDTTCCISVDTTGTYILSVTNMCGTIEDSASVFFAPCNECLWAPNAFTPNNDGKNDVFRVINRCGRGVYHIIIVNRFGAVVYSSYNVSEGWDGTYNGQPVDIGTYYYYITLSQAALEGDITLKGDVTVVR